MATTVKTNKGDYAPGETAHISAEGFAEGASIRFQVVNLGADGLLGTADDIAYPSWIVTDSAGSSFSADADGRAGSVATSWVVPESALNSTLVLTAESVTAGEDGQLGTADDQSAGQLATTTFTDANPGPLQTYFVPLPEQQVNYIFNDLENSQVQNLL
ncbi:hypothetical protein [Accumulibacter sp.]|uniref:hypothetical protein n=1 Tax=Accumulibacter sp. TaxID=2053492 RepID=UPI0025D2B7EC|nr:hypothetical protein [Accumulibacter sp.]MCM8596890.1 hypothetical protein [Accumulibacter sp.]MDS4051038.1 hypothetical protein [Accumulibacter sp.]